MDCPHLPQLNFVDIFPRNAVRIQQLYLPIASSTFLCHPIYSIVLPELQESEEHKVNGKHYW